MEANIASTFTTNKHLEMPAHGDYVDDWEIPVNQNSDDIDRAFGGSALLNATGDSGDHLLIANQFRALSLLVSGAPIADLTYTVPSGVGGQWVFRNGTTGGFDIGLRSLAGGPTVTVDAGTTALISCDGSASGVRLSVTTSSAAAGANTQVQYNSGGALAASANMIFDGTTFAATGLYVPGNTVLGLGSGSTTTINGTVVAAPNNLNISAGALFVNTTTKAIGVGTTTVGTDAIRAAGVIRSSVGGYRFPDGSLQTTAAGVSGAAGSDTWVQYNTGGGFNASATFTFAAGVLNAPELALTTALAVSSGGTGVTSSTGTGAGVHAVSPALTGVPTAPTAAPGTNTTQIATMAAIAAAVVVGLQQHVYTANATFTPTATGTYKITVTGPGAAGFSSVGAGDAGGGGGGAGGTAIIWRSLTASTGYAVVVGSPGTNSSFDGTVIGNFGVAGSLGVGGAGGTASGGTINIPGGDGTGGCVESVAGVASPTAGGTGGASIWGGGGAGGGAAAGAGRAWGAGGGGTSSNVGGGGGAGKAGIVVIEWVGA